MSRRIDVCASCTFFRLIYTCFDSIVRHRFIACRRIIETKSVQRQNRQQKLSVDVRFACVVCTTSYAWPGSEQKQTARKRFAHHFAQRQLDVVVFAVEHMKMILFHSHSLTDWVVRCVRMCAVFINNNITKRNVSARALANTHTHSERNTLRTVSCTFLSRVAHFTFGPKIRRVFAHRQTT